MVLVRLLQTGTRSNSFKLVQNLASTMHNILDQIKKIRQVAKKSTPFFSMQQKMNHLIKKGVRKNAIILGRWPFSFFIKKSATSMCKNQHKKKNK